MRQYECTIDCDGSGTVTADGPREAAVEYAKRLCRLDPDWFSHFEQGVTVQVRGASVARDFTVEMEAVPVFRAIPKR